MTRPRSSAPNSMLLAALVASVALVASASMGCNGKNAATETDAALESGAPTPSASSPAPDPSASGAPSASAFTAAVPPARHARGPVGLFFRAAADADLTDDAKAAIAKIEEPLLGVSAPRTELAAYHSDLITGVKSGRIDQAKMQADEAAIVKAYAALQLEQATALGGLHDALTSEQRKAVGDAIRAMQSAHDHPPQVSGESGVSDKVARRAGRIKDALKLDADQQKLVSAVVARSANQPTAAAAQSRFDAGKKQMDALVAAFEKDAFDPKKIDLSPVPGRKPTESMDRQVKYLTQLLPILEDEQRDKLASIMDHAHADRSRSGMPESIAEPLDLTEGRPGAR